MNIVLDTNIIISALIKDNISRYLIVNSNDSLLLPEFGLTEIEKHKDELIEKANLIEEDFDILLKDLLSYIKIIKTKEIINYREEAFKIMKDIDKDDSLFIATALSCNAVIWSDDEHFQKQNKIKILKTEDMVSLMNL